jgi:hypothetical protein
MKIPLIPKKNVPKEANLLGHKIYNVALNITLVTIENDNPLSTIKKTTIAFKTKYPNLDLTLQQMN